MTLRTLLLLAAPAVAWAQEPADDPGSNDLPADELPIIEGPSILEYVEAPHPAEALEQGLEGVVTLLVELDETGAVTAVEVLQAAGHGFDEAAVAAVQQMRFSPAQTEAGPVPVAFEFNYGFTLEPEPEPEPTPEELPVNLVGDVLEMGTRRPIADAVLSIPELGIEARSDEDGHFEMRGLPVGASTVRVLHPGHVSADNTVRIYEGEQSEWRFWLRAEEYRNNEVVGTYQRQREEITRRTITMEEARRIPGTFGDPIKVVQTLPGAARSPFGTGLLVIRGSNPEDSAVYVDGIRIPLIYHLTGTTSVLSPDLIASVDYLPGNYGTQYGRSTGGVIDVKTKETFDDSRLVWGTDILDTQLYWEGNVGGERKHGLSLGARRSYIDAFLPLVTGDTGFTIKPRYWDYSAKWVPPTREGEYASVFVYGFNDLIALATPADTAQGSDRDTQGDFRTEYQSHRVIARYRRALSEKWTLDLTPSIGIDTTSAALGQGFRIANTNGLFQLRASVPYTASERFTLTPGVDLIGGPWRFDFRSPLGVSDAEDPLAERDPVAFDGHGTAWTIDTYLKAQVRPLPDPDQWLLTAGVRGNTLLYIYGGSINDDGDVPPYSRFSLDPRFATRLRLFDGGTVKAATGIFHQPAQPYESVGLGTAVDLAFERSWSTTLGFEHQLSPAISWDVDLFYKDLSQLVVMNSGFTGSGTTAFVNQGNGRAYGAEFIARHAPVGRFFGWVSYTLSRSERQDGPDQAKYLFDFDQTHIFSAQASYQLPRDFSISAQVQYVTGNPTSPYSTGVYDVDGNFYNPLALGGYNSERLPPFFQTSLRFDKLWTFRTWQLNTYVDLLNAVRGVNPEFTLYNGDYTEYAYVRGLPFIPNVGFEARFYP